MCRDVLTEHESRRGCRDMGVEIVHEDVIQETGEGHDRKTRCELRIVKELSMNLKLGDLVTFTTKDMYFMIKGDN